MSEAASVRRRPRTVGVIVIALALAILAATVVGIALDDGSDKRIEIEGAGATQRLLGGIEQDGASLGSGDSPVTVEVFNDVQCEACADWQRETIDPLIEPYVRDDEVRLVFRHFSLGEHPSQVGALAATAAGIQGRQWQYISIFEQNLDELRAGVVSEDYLEGVANAVLEFDVEQWKQDFDDAEVTDTVDADARLALDRRLPAEPAVVVTGPLRSRELIESPTLDEVTSAIEAVGEPG